MDEGLVNVNFSIPSDDEAATFVQPSDGALDAPAVAVTPQLAPVLPLRPGAVAPVRTNQVDAALVPQRRLLMRRRPPLGDCITSGSSGSITAHCRSVNSDACRAMVQTPFYGT
jgi:hypothetical protein